MAVPGLALRADATGSLVLKQYGRAKDMPVIGLLGLYRGQEQAWQASGLRSAQ